MYYEEPNTLSNLKLARNIKEIANIPLAGGEKLYS